MPIHRSVFALTLLVILCVLFTACGSGDASSDAITDGDIDTTDGDATTDGDESTDGDEEPTDGDSEDVDTDSIDGDDEAEAESALPFDFPADHPLNTSGVLNIAHRGGGALAPEETMPAYENAVAVGADMLEMDLHSTSDGVIVLHHDAGVSRMTNGTGDIKDMTFDELRQLDSGYNWTNDGGQTYPFRDQGVVVATFKEVLEAFPDMIFSAELKQITPSIVDPVLAILAETDMEDRVILVSFSDATMADVREKNPRIITGAGTVEMVQLTTQTPESADSYIPPCPIFQLSGVEPYPLSLAHELGLKIQVWTINREDDMRHYIDIGVDGIMTDNPELLESILAK